MLHFGGTPKRANIVRIEMILWPKREGINKDGTSDEMGKTISERASRTDDSTDGAYSRALRTPRCTALAYDQIMRVLVSRVFSTL
jgi:hypothetical protein